MPYNSPAAVNRFDENVFIWFIYLVNVQVEIIIDNITRRCDKNRCQLWLHYFADYCRHPNNENLYRCLACRADCLFDCSSIVCPSIWMVAGGILQRFVSHPTVAFRSLAIDESL